MVLSKVQNNSIRTYSHQAKKDQRTRMHSSRMRTVCNSSRLLEGVSAPGRGAWSGGVCSGGCLVPGGGITACTEADPPVNRMTDTCKNITFATSLRTVIVEFIIDDWHNH